MTLLKPQQLGDLRAVLTSKINCVILHVQLEIVRYPEFQICITVVSLYAGCLENIDFFPTALLLEIMAFNQHDDNRKRCHGKNFCVQW